MFDIHGFEESVFRYSCMYGRLEAAKWLYQLGVETNSPINIHAHNEYAFRNSCSNGYLDVAKWLYQLGMDINSPIDIHVMKNDAFIMSCVFIHYNVFNWLMSINNRVIFVHDNDYYCDNNFYENTLQRFTNLLSGQVLQLKGRINK